MEQVTQITSMSRLAYDDYAFIMCLGRRGFNAIPHIIKYHDQSMMVVVEGRRLLCSFCKQLGHFSRSCPQKVTTTTTTTTTTSTTRTTATATTIDKTAPTTDTIKEIEDYPNKKRRGEVDPSNKGKKEKIPIKRIPIKRFISRRKNKTPGKLTPAKSSPVKISPAKSQNP